MWRNILGVFVGKISYQDNKRMFCLGKKSMEWIVWMLYVMGKERIKCEKQYEDSLRCDYLNDKGHNCSGKRSASTY
jgi:hypothetical protein